MTREEAIYQLMGLMPSKEKIVNSWTKEHLEALSMAIRALENNPWHKVLEELPMMAHFTIDGNFSDLCVCINESGEHMILVLCESGDDIYWAYGYDGEGLYDEEMDGGEIVKWMELPKED